MSSSEEELAARLDEDEAAAKEAASNDDRARSWADAEGGYPVAGPVVVDGWGVAIVPLGARWGQVRHIARHDPARVLRFVEAGREILTECETGGGNTWSPDYYAGLSFAICALGDAYRDAPSSSAATS